MKKKIGWYFAGVLALAMVARAGIITYNAILLDASALAYNNTYPINLNTNGIGTLSAQAYYSTATVPAATFQDGSQSLGSFTIASFAALKSARAVNNITITSTSSLTNARVAVPGYTFSNGQDWATGATTHAAALSLGAALATVPYLSVSVSGSVVYTTATAGVLYNSYKMTSSNGNVVVATPQFTGGQDNASATINGVVLLQGRDWTAATSNAASATSLASAINAASLLNTHITAQAIGAVVSATSTLNGSLYNYSLKSSTQSQLAASGANMTNGVTAGFTLGSTIFTAVNGSGLTLALPVLYTGTPAIGGLLSGTTYYPVPTSGNSFKLSKYSTSAVAGIDLVTVTSTNTQITQHTYTLAPLAISGNPSFKWQVSNDFNTWTDLAVSSVTTGLTNPANTTIWSFGFIGTQYLRLNVIAPTTGGLALRVQLIGTN